MRIPRTSLPAAAIALALTAHIHAQGGQGNAAPSGQVLLPSLTSLKVGGEYRLRFENFYNYDLNGDAVDDRDVFTQRLRLNFDAEVNEDYRLFFQVQDVRNWGEESSTVDRSADGIDFHQGYLAVRDVPGIGGDGKLGRQVLAFGDQRLVGGLEWLSQGRAFDGHRQTWKSGDSFTIDGFATHIAEMPATTGLYDDAYFVGAYASNRPEEGGELDVYALHLSVEETAAGGTENRTTLGFRWEENVGGVEVGAELATQTGEVNGADIPIGETYAAHLHGRLNLEGDSKAWIGLEFNTASGNDPNSSDNERFNTLFPTAHAHLGMMDLALWENVLHGAAQFGFKPDEASRVVTSWHIFETVEETDVFKGPAGTLSGGGAGFGNSMGNEIDILYHRDIDADPARASVQFGYGLFLPGSGAEDANGGNDDLAHFFYAMCGLNF